MELDVFTILKVREERWIIFLKSENFIECINLRKFFKKLYNLENTNYFHLPLTH